MFLAAIGADDGEIEAAFQKSIRAAKQQKSFALLTRAQVSHAEYCAEKDWGRRNAEAQRGVQVDTGLA